MCRAVAHVDAALPEEVANILAGGGGGGGGDASAPSPAAAPSVPAATTDPGTTTDAQGQATDVVKSEEGVGAAAPAEAPATTHDAAVTAVGGYSHLWKQAGAAVLAVYSVSKSHALCVVSEGFIPRGREWEGEGGEGEMAALGSFPVSPTPPPCPLFVAVHALSDSKTPFVPTAPTPVPASGAASVAPTEGMAEEDQGTQEQVDPEGVDNYVEAAQEHYDTDEVCDMRLLLI
jgi:hypothetical protein